MNDSVLVFDDVLNESGLEFLRGLIATGGGEWGTVLVKSEAGEKWIVDREFRNAKSLVPKGVDRGQVDAFLWELSPRLIEPFFRKRVLTWDEPQLLNYPTGGLYMPHTDSDVPVDGRYDGQWERAQDRDVSLVLFLNDADGGELVFPNQNLEIGCVAGRAVLFPSGFPFVHGVAPVLSGHKWSLACWARTGDLARPAVSSEQSRFLGSVRITNASRFTY